MTNWQYPLLAVVGVLFILAFLKSVFRKRKLQQHLDFTRNLETLLLPRESVKVICPQKNFRCILTNKRIILESNGSYTAFPLKSIQKIQGSTQDGKRTSSCRKMEILALKMEQDLILRNTGSEFEEAVKYLQAKQKKRSRKKAPRRT